MNFIIPNEINFAISTLENAGFEAYVVGGCVRDMLLKKKPQDYDITTSATPEEIISLFPHTVPTGIKHGTVTVVFESGATTEITTFRTEGKYTDNRHPQNVHFVKTIEEDLSRRDFTVNAMAFSNNRGLKDFFCGLEDLNSKILRTVGDPDLRFNEDALRILRLFRFSSQLEFVIEENTINSALNLSNKLFKISRERIREEILKALCGQNPAILTPLLKTDCFSFLGIDKNSCCFGGISKIPNQQILRFSYFCFKNNLNPLEIAQNLRCSKAFGKTCENVCSLLKSNTPHEKSEIKQMLKHIPLNDFKAYLEIQNSLCDTSSLKDTFFEIIKNDEPYSLSQLAVNGNDLKTLGINDIEIKTVLDGLLDIVIKNPDLNTKELLIKYVSK